MLSTINTVAWLGLVALAFLGLMFLKGAHVKWDWRDLWQGVYFGDDAIYVCFIPFLVFVFPRKDNEGL